MTLVSVLIHKVIATNSSPVMILWELGIGNRLGISVFGHELLSLLECSLEVGTLTKIGLSSDLAINLGKRDWLIAVRSIVFVMFLIFANIGLPSEVHLVNS